MLGTLFSPSSAMRRDAATTAAPQPGSAQDAGLLPVCLAAALLVGLAHRLLVGWRAPLWLDENFTAAIATQPDFHSLIRWCLHELTGPVYYVPIWCWEKLAGPSDTALRLPSLACSIAAPLLLLWRGHPDRVVRQIWSALAAVWLPGLMLACEAKPYALVVLLTTAQAIAFLGMMRAPGVRTAAWWAGMSALAVLTHYHALVITGLQGLFYLAAGGRPAWRSWPAALLFVPVAAWMSFHLPFVLRYAAPNVVWYNQADASLVPLAPMILFGVGLPAALLLAAMAATWAWQWARFASGAATFGYERGEILLVASGFGAFLIVFAMAFVRPSFTARYMMPFMPAILFGVALWARHCGRHWRIVTAVLLGSMIAVAAGATVIRTEKPRDTDHRYSFNFEEPSAWLRARGVRRMVFLWDSPTAAIGEPYYFTQLADFFFWRDGRPVPIILPVLPYDADPNIALPAAARGAKTGILWAYDTGVPSTRGRLHPARIDRIDPRWTCRDFGGGPISVVACIR